jgi:hypothetical protein
VLFRREGFLLIYGEYFSVQLLFFVFSFLFHLEPLLSTKSNGLKIFWSFSRFFFFKARRPIIYLKDIGLEFLQIAIGGIS